MFRTYGIASTGTPISVQFHTTEAAAMQALEDLTYSHPHYREFHVEELAVVRHSDYLPMDEQDHLDAIEQATNAVEEVRHNMTPGPFVSACGRQAAAYRNFARFLEAQGRDATDATRAAEAAENAARYAGMSN